MQTDNRIYELSGCTPTEIAVLRLIAYAFSGKPVNKEEFKDTDWRAVLDELKAQAMAAVPIDVVSQLADIIPPKLFEEWLMLCTKVMGYGEGVLGLQQELTELLAQNNIPMGILKGTAAAYCYPDPLYRNMGDIDFLVDRSDFDRAYKLLTDNGFTLSYDEDHTDYHLTLGKQGMTYELHREPAGIAHSKKGDMLRELFVSCCGDSVRCEIAGYEFYKLPRLQNGLVLLLHIVKHLDEGIGLRQICDWEAFVQKELSDEVWRNEFRPVLDKTGLSSLAMITTRLCKIYLGLDGVTWCDGVSESDCAEFMRFVLDNGNFGRKNENTLRARNVLGQTKENEKKPFILSMLIALQKNGVEQWGAVKKIPILKCVAWAYVPIRYIGRLLTGKRSIAETKDLVSVVGSKKSLQDKLAVYR